jgi:hypothetical protein
VLPWQAGANVAFTRVRKRAKLAVARRVQCGVGQAGVAGRLMNEGSRWAVRERTLTAVLDANYRRSHVLSELSSRWWRYSVVRRPPKDGRPSPALACAASRPRQACLP